MSEDEKKRFGKAPPLPEGAVFLVNDCQIAYSATPQTGLVLRLTIASKNQPRQTYYFEEELARFLLTRLKEMFGEIPAPKAPNLRN